MEVEQEDTKQMSDDDDARRVETNDTWDTNYSLRGHINYSLYDLFNGPIPLDLERETYIHEPIIINGDPVVLRNNLSDVFNASEEEDEEEEIYGESQIQIQNVGSQNAEPTRQPLTMEDLVEQLAEPCPVCWDDMAIINLTVTRCGHVFHTSCLFQSFSVRERRLECPLCRTLIAV
jgi:hypothetical protein